jgi:hypothetical protein
LESSLPEWEVAFRFRVVPVASLPFGLALGYMKYRYSLILLLLLPFVVAPGARAFTSIDYGPNWADDSVLVRGSTNIFIGKVLAQIGT